MPKTRDTRALLWRLLREAEREILVQAFGEDRNVIQTAAMLGVSRGVLYNRMQKHGIRLRDLPGKGRFVRRKASLLSSWVASQVSESSEPSGNGSPSRAVRRAAMPWWLTEAAKSK